MLTVDRIGGHVFHGLSWGGGVFFFFSGGGFCFHWVGWGGGDLFSFPGRRFKSRPPGMTLWRNDHYSITGFDK